MAVINARCMRCNFVFPFMNVPEGALLDSQISNNLASCQRPGCGGMARVDDVTFDAQGRMHTLVNSTFGALTDPRVTRSDLEQLFGRNWSPKTAKNNF